MIAFAVVLLDQLTKLYIKLNFEYREAVSVIGDFFKIQFIENKGAAFGLTVSKIVNSLGGNMSDETGKLILSLFSIGAVVVIGVVVYRLASHRSPLPWFVALIFGGALGNIIDRTFYGMWFSDINNYAGGLFHGRVVDFLYLDIWEGTVAEWVPLFGGSYTSLWPIFNVADAAISIGIVAILFFQGRFFKMDEEARQAETITSATGATPTKPSPKEDKDTKAESANWELPQNEVDASAKTE
ncbi:MAG: signal peptidase II [Bacteroidota bacterium]